MSYGCGCRQLYVSLIHDDDDDDDDDDDAISLHTTAWQRQYRNFAALKPLGGCPPPPQTPPQYGAVRPECYNVVAFAALEHLGGCPPQTPTQYATVRPESYNVVAFAALSSAALVYSFGFRIGAALVVYVRPQLPAASAPAAQCAFIPSPAPPGPAPPGPAPPGPAPPAPLPQPQCNLALPPWRNARRPGSSAYFARWRWFEMKI